MNKIAGRNIFQMAWVVDDIQASIAQWNKDLGAGPFYLIDIDNPYPNLRYRGQPGQMSQKVAWSQMGDTQIEFIEVTGDHPNVYRDLVPKGRTQFHHVCIWSDDFDGDEKRFNELGFETAMILPEGDGRFAYYDNPKAYGHMIEVLERGPLVPVFDLIKDVCAKWDGKDLVRDFTSLQG